MGVFTGESPGDGAELLEWAAARVKRRAARLGLLSSGERRWSIAELQLTDDDYGWLRWAIERCTAQHCWALGATVATGVADVGLLLLALVAECARREACEDELWPTIGAQPFWHDKHVLLDNGRQVLMFLIHQAAETYGTRRCPASANRQYHRDTVFLQFGFTQEGCINRLGDWLRGTGTYAMGELLDGVDEAENQSDSFRELVRALRRYQRREWPKQALLDVLNDSPWVLPDWRDELLEALEQTGELAYDARLDELPERPLLGEPRLRWEGGTPRVELAVETHRRWSDDYTAPCYHVYLGGRRELELRRREIGNEITYRLPQSVPVVSLPCDDLPPRLSAQVQTPQGNVIESFCWVIWEPQQEVNLWDERGARLDAQTRLDPAKSYTLLVPDGCRIEPASTDAPWYRTDDGLLVHLAAGWPKAVRLVTRDGELLWQPATGEMPERPDWLEAVNVEADSPLTFGEAPQITISAPAQVRVLWARLDGEPQVLEGADTSCVRFAGGPVGPGAGCERLLVQVGASLDDEELRRTYRVPLPLDGDVLVRARDDEPGSSGRQALGPAAKIIPSGPPPQLLFFRPTAQGLHEVRAGCQRLGFAELQAPKTPLTLASWSVGLGEELCLWQADQRVRSLGCICSARPFDELVVDGDLVTIPWPSPPGPEHAVHWWGWDGVFRTLAPCEVDGAFLAQMPSGQLPRALAVTWQGQWQEDGTWHHATWHDGLDGLGPETVVQAAWLRLPLLASPARELLTRLVDDRSTDVVNCWLSNAGLPEGLSQVDKEVRQEVSAALKLRPGDLAWGREELSKLLATEQPANQLHQLADWDPVWVDSVLREWVVHEGLGRFGVVRTAQLITGLAEHRGGSATEELRTLAGELGAVVRERERWLKSMPSP